MKGRVLPFLLPSKPATRSGLDKWRDYPHEPQGRLPKDRSRMTTPAQGNFSGLSGPTGKQPDAGFEASGLSPEDAERFASSFKPSWEFDEAPFTQANGNLDARQLEALSGGAPASSRQAGHSGRETGEARTVPPHAPPQRLETNEPEVSVIIDRSITAAEIEAQRPPPKPVSVRPPAPMFGAVAAPVAAASSFASPEFAAPVFAPAAPQRVAPVMRGPRTADESLELPASLKKSNKGLFIGLGVAVAAAGLVLLVHGAMSSSEAAPTPLPRPKRRPRSLLPSRPRARPPRRFHLRQPRRFPPPRLRPHHRRPRVPRWRWPRRRRSPRLTRLHLPRCTTLRLGPRPTRPRPVGSSATTRSERAAHSPGTSFLRRARREILLEPGASTCEPHRRCFALRERKMKTRPLAFALLLALSPAAVLPPRAAFAQAADETTTKMARQRFQEGVAFYDKGQFEMARAAFLQAYALRKHPTVLLNLAQSSLKSGHTLEAARYFQQFLKESSSATDAQRADASKGLGEARMKLGRIDVVGATVGADVFVDDERIGMAPLDHSVDVEPGTHTVRSQGPNGEQSIPVTANPGQGVTAKFSAAAAAPAAPPPPAAPSEPTPEPAPPPASEPTPETAMPPAAPTASPSEESSERSHHWGWVAATGVVTVVGFTVAAIMGLEKQSAQNSANAVATTIVASGGKQGACNPATGAYVQYCNALNTDNNNVNADATIANIGIAVGLIGAAGLIASTIVAATSYGGEPTKAAPATTSGSTSSLRMTPIYEKSFKGMSLQVTF